MGSRQRFERLTLVLPFAAIVCGWSGGSFATSLPERQPEVVVIGSGERMDALHRAVAEQVAIINEDGGVMDKPLKLTRIARACGSSKAAAPLAEDEQSAPLVIFEDFCPSTGLKVAEAYARRGVLFMGVGDWSAALTEDDIGPTVFRLSPRNDRRTRELAFALATSEAQTILWKNAANPAAGEEGRSEKLSDVREELERGFEATPQEEARWGRFVPKARIDLIDVSDPADFKTQVRRQKTALLFIRGTAAQMRQTIEAATAAGWRGPVIAEIGAKEAGAEILARRGPKALPDGIEISVFQRQAFYLGSPPAGAKAYTAFHPDWVAGFWQAMKAVKYATSFDGRDIAKTLGGVPFFSRAPWLMLQSRSRYLPLELRQRFNANGDLRMAGYELKKIWPK